VVYEAGDGFDIETAKVVETFIRPTPIEFVQAAWSSTLPQHWITNTLDPQRSEAIQITEP
jgi:hypothetical protein